MSRRSNFALFVPIPFILILLLSSILIPAYSAPQEGGRLTVVREIDADNYDPHRAVAQAAVEVVFLLADTLFVMDYDLQTPIPHLVTHWDVSEDGRVYTFQLREDVIFHSGRGMTAADVKYSLERWQQKSPNAWAAGQVDEIVILDDYSLEYRLIEPHSEFLEHLTMNYAMIVDKEVTAELGDRFGVTGFGATGPFVWVHWTPRDELLLKRNPHYSWGPEELYQNTGPAYLEEILFKIVPESGIRILELERGVSDLAYYTNVPLKDIKRLQAAPNIIVDEASPFLWVGFLGFKIDRPMVSDVAVREAINRAIHKEMLNRDLWYENRMVADTLVHPGALDAWTPDPQSVLSYNPEKAEELLDRAGWLMGEDGFRYQGGERLSPVLYSFVGWVEDVTAIQGMLREVGIDLQVRVLDATIIWSQLRTQDFDLFTMSTPYLSAGFLCGLYYDSQNVPAPNRFNWIDEETDHLLAAGKEAILDDERRAIYQRIQEKVYAGILTVPMYHERLFVAYQDRIQGFVPHSHYAAPLYKGLDIWMVE